MITIKKYVVVKNRRYLFLKDNFHHRNIFNYTTYYTSLADRSTSKLLNRIVNYDVLVIDELGYLTLNNEQINMFFKLIDMRYRRKTTIITTNLEYSEWYDVFGNKNLVDAMLDRLRHYSTTIRITGDKGLRKPVSSIAN